MTIAISTHGLTKRYRGVAALTAVSLEVPTGSIYGFLGPNGAGKTTALKILAGLTRPTSGRAAIDGVEVGRAGAHRRKVGYLAQDPRFYPWMTGRETLDYVASFYPRGGHERTAGELLDLVGLADAADRATKTYSGGMRQRLGIAQALVGGTSVLLLDEPAAALDPIGRHDVLELLGHLRGEVTVFYSTHILDDVQRVSDRVGILDRGRLVLDAPTAELVGQAATGSVQVALIGATDATADALASLDGVTSVRSVEAGPDERRYELVVDDGRAPAVQRAVMSFAAAHDLVITSNRQEALDLEDVFLRIVHEERAA